MNAPKRSISILGVALIVIGLGMILRRFHIISLGFAEIFWPLVMIFGLMSAGQGFARNRRGKIFWGTVWFMSALFFFLRASELGVHGYMIVPAIFFILSIAFMMMFLNDLHEWIYLVPASILGSIGIIVLLAETDYLSGWQVYDVLRTYWPISLIIIGVAFLLRHRGNDTTQQSVS